MLIKTTQAGGLIIEEAEKLLLSKCIEKTGKNDGPCIKSIVERFRDLYGENHVRDRSQIAYCAMTANVIVGNALERLNIKNPVWSAGTTGILSKARAAGIRVDKVPAPGAIFLARSSGSSSGFHAGVVWYLRDDRIGTIEGNSSGYIIEEDGCTKKSPRNGVLAKERKINSRNIPYYIHVEEIEGQDFSQVGDRELEHTGLIQAYGGTVGNLSEDEWWVGQYCEFDWKAWENVGDEDSPDDEVNEDGTEKISNLALAAITGVSLFGIYLMVK